MMRNLYLLFFFLIVLNARSQTRFDRALNIPVTENGSQLRFPWTGGINFPWFSSMDLNGETLPDIFFLDHHNNRILTFTNNGSQNPDQAWDYAPQYAGQFPPVNKFAFLYD